MCSTCAHTRFLNRSFGGDFGGSREAESLFVLVRDVPEFEKKFASDVLAFVKDLGFTGRSKRPQRIVQEGCLPFDPTSGAQKVRKMHSAVLVRHVTSFVRVITRVLSSGCGDWTDRNPCTSFRRTHHTAVSRSPERDGLGQLLYRRPCSIALLHLCVPCASKWYPP